MNYASRIANKLLAADERRLAQIKNSCVIRVHPRSSAAKLFFGLFLLASITLAQQKGRDLKYATAYERADQSVPSSVVINPKDDGRSPGASASGLRYCELSRALELPGTSTARPHCSTARCRRTT